MTLEQAASLVSIATGVVSLLAVIVLWATKITAIEVKVDTLWGLQMRLAEQRVVQQGRATRESPLSISDEMLSLYEDMKLDLQAYYARLGRRLTDRELAFEIERQFGQQIKEICISAGMDQAECLLYAAAVAKGNKTVDVT